MQERTAVNASHKVMFAEPGDGEVRGHELMVRGCFAGAALPLPLLGAADSVSSTALRHHSHDKSRPMVKCSRHSLNKSRSFEVVGTP